MSMHRNDFWTLVLLTLLLVGATACGEDSGTAASPTNAVASTSARAQPIETPPSYLPLPTATPKPLPVVVSTPTPPPTPAPIAASSPTAAPTPTATPRPTAAPTPTSVPTPTAVAAPSPTPLPTEQPRPPTESISKPESGVTSSDLIIEVSTACYPGYGGPSTTVAV